MYNDVIYHHVGAWTVTAGKRLSANATGRSVCSQQRFQAALHVCHHGYRLPNRAQPGWRHLEDALWTVVTARRGACEAGPDEALGLEAIERDVEGASGEGPVRARGDFVTNGRAVGLLTAGAQVQHCQQDDDFEFTEGRGQEPTM